MQNGHIKVQDNEGVWHEYARDGKYIGVTKPVAAFAREHLRRQTIGTDLWEYRPSKELLDRLGFALAGTGDRWSPLPPASVQPVDLFAETLGQRIEVILEPVDYATYPYPEDLPSIDEVQAMVAVGARKKPSVSAVFIRQKLTDSVARLILIGFVAAVEYADERRSKAWAYFHGEWEPYRAPSVGPAKFDGLSAEHVKDWLWRDFQSSYIHRAHPGGETF